MPFSQTTSCALQQTFSLGKLLLGETTPFAPLGETPRPQWLPKTALSATPSHLFITIQYRCHKYGYGIFIEMQTLKKPGFILI